MPWYRLSFSGDKLDTIKIFSFQSRSSDGIISIHLQSTGTSPLTCCMLNNRTYKYYNNLRARVR